MSLRNFPAAILISTALLLAACSQDRQYENYPNLQSNADLTTTPASHPHGYGRADCFFCHVAVNIHQVDRYGSGVLTFAQDATNQLAESGCTNCLTPIAGGTTSCATCHGQNGVTP